MPRDVQIRLGDGNAPQSYEVPNAAELIPLCVNAVFDGSGAAGDFVPTVEIISDGGVVVARVPCKTAVAAGDSAEVTFAPFLRDDGQTSTAGALPVASLWNTSVGTANVLSPGAGVTLAFDHFDTTDAAVFSQSGASNIVVAAKGVYLIYATLPAAATGGVATVDDLLAATPGGNRNPGGNNSQGTRYFQNPPFNSINPGVTTMYQADAGDSIFVEVSNLTGALTYTIKQAALFVTLLSPTAF